MISLPNVQPSEKYEHREDGSLEVQSCFLTIQGEGPLAGRSSVFLRLNGCTLSCPNCDTDYTSSRTLFSVPSLLSLIEEKWTVKSKRKLVVLTGGEPFRQNISPLVDKLISREFSVQIETNGTLPPKDLNLFADVVCSPKTPRINSDLERIIHSYKYVLKAEQIDPIDGLPVSSLGMPFPPARPHVDFRGEIFVQPEDEKILENNTRNLRVTVQSCFKFGYRLSIQGHKLAELE